MQNNTEQPNWKVLLPTTIILLIAVAVFTSAKVAFALGGMLVIFITFAWLSRLATQKSHKPAFSYFIQWMGLVFALGWMQWYTGEDHTINGFLAETGKIGAILGIPALVLIALLGVSAYWKKQNPPTVVPPVNEEIPQLESEFLKWYARGTGLLFAGWLIFGYLSFLFLRAFGDWYYSNLIKGIIVEPADPAMWGIVALFLGIYISMLAVGWLLKISLRDNYEKFKNYYDYRMGFDNKKAGLTIGLLYAVLIFGVIFINLTLYARFTETEIAIRRPYWINEQVHSYSDITSIQQITTVHRKSDGNIFVINFSDGTSWKSTSYDTGDIPQYYPAILDLASSKSGISVNYVVKNASE